ncbi:crossover junction endodeoxyribonuclease RuvC [Tengunoibacter tsumagoiensis]|uniref:Crossover junction endodeoxyribonuclease RuvC n=1 Tax=Tengunoibacter tsumagoiensis TaxID=2014871 RepID=A0A402A2A5_9CHLR|nr:crossover junction endodeoxyribonuclease RuvC [Tengunoibacter tsumagoiensis]GCE13192.1 crossover junction endodeoxyribonuclease RuvC [Tengunoibacter tsumagoiensis]
MHNPVTLPPHVPAARIALGIDPGTAIVGYAVVMAQGSTLSMLACDVITTPAKTPLAQRLQLIYQGLSTIIATYQPNEAAMEELFFAKNARTAMTVGQARGVAMLALANGGLSVAEYTPKQVKQAVTGYGGADKNQVGEMVKILLQLPSIPKPDDAADAAAVALCHLQTATYLYGQQDLLEYR